MVDLQLVTCRFVPKDPLYFPASAKWRQLYVHFSLHTNFCTYYSSSYLFLYSFALLLYLRIPAVCDYPHFPLSFCPRSASLFGRSNVAIINHTHFYYFNFELQLRVQLLVMCVRALEGKPGISCQLTWKLKGLESQARLSHILKWYCLEM